MIGSGVEFVRDLITEYADKEVYVLEEANIARHGAAVPTAVVADPKSEARNTFQDCMDVSVIASLGFEFVSDFG